MLSSHPGTAARQTPNSLADFRRNELVCAARNKNLRPARQTLAAVALSGCLALSAPIFAAPAPNSVTELPTALPPQSEVVTFARAHDIPLEGIEAPSLSEKARYGDAFTALVTLREGKTQRQWLTRFAVVERNAEERKQTISETVTMTMAGRETKFTATRDMALAIKTAGPFVAGKKSPPSEKEARALTSPAFLQLGFDRVCRTLAQLASTGGSTTASPAAAAEKTPELSEEQMRSFAGLFPTLTAFFGSIEKTPGLREILWDVVDKPSLWSLAKHRGITPGFNLNGAMGDSVDPAGWGVVTGTSLFQFGFELQLNGEPALLCTLFVTSPKPPLLASAGVLGIVAESPDRKKRLDIRVLAAQRGRETAGANNRDAAK